MYVEIEGNAVFLSQPLGWDMDDGRIVLSLRDVKDLREVLSHPAFHNEGVDNGEDG